VFKKRGEGGLESSGCQQGGCGASEARRTHVLQIAGWSFQGSQPRSGGLLRTGSGRRFPLLPRPPSRRRLLRQRDSVETLPHPIRSAANRWLRGPCSRRQSCQRSRSAGKRRCATRLRIRFATPVHERDRGLASADQTLQTPNYVQSRASDDDLFRRAQFVFPEAASTRSSSARYARVSGSSASIVLAMRSLSRAASRSPARRCAKPASAM